MKKLLVVVMTFVSLASPDFNFSDINGKVVVTSGSNLNLVAPINNFSGSLVIQSSASVAGQVVNFVEGSLQEGTGTTISGANFSRDYTTIGASTGPSGLVLSGDQTVSISGPVPSGIFVTGTGNVISGAPVFSSQITLDSSSATSLGMAISSECSTDIDVNGNTLQVVTPLTMSPGNRIKSSTGSATVNLDNQKLAIGGVSGGWTENFTWTGGGQIGLTSDLALQGAWDFSGNTTFASNGSTLDLTSTSAAISIESGASIQLQGVTLNGVQTGKILFADTTSTLSLVNSTLVLSGSFNQSTGNLQTSNTTLQLGAFPWTQGASASFANVSGQLWLDSGSSAQPPTFGQVDPSTGAVTSYVDNSTVRQTVDYNQVSPAPNRQLVSGNVNQDLTLTSNVTLAPAQAIIATADSTVSADGVGFDFNDTGGPQLVVQQNKTLTIAGSATFNTTPATFNIESNATLAFNGNSKINIQGDTSVATGTITVAQPPIIGGELPIPQTLTLAGPGGTTRFGLTSAMPTSDNPNPTPATIDIGSGQLIIKNMDFYGLENVVKSSLTVAGNSQSGAIILAGQAKVHVQESSDMNFHILGEDNYLVIENNGVSFTGNFTFDDNGNNELHIRFDLATEVDQPTIQLGAGCLNLFSVNGIAKFIFDDPEVFLTLLAPTSFVTGGHSFLDGFDLTIQQNPIVQGTSDFALGDDLNLMNDSTIDSPLLFTGAIGRDWLLKTFPRLALCERSPVNQFENYFRNPALARSSIPIPNLRLIKSMTISRAKGVIKLLSGGSISNFGSDPFAALVLELSGNTTITPVQRREKRTVNPIRSPFSRASPNFADPSYTDTIKNTDVIYVSGTNNTIVVTGNMMLNSQMVFDEGSELIFQFDDSVDTPKAILLNVQDPDGNPGLVLPPSASLVFTGHGQVLFQDQATVTFNGDDPTPVSGSTNFVDDRPTMIFRDYAQLDMEQGETISFGGKGQLLFQSNAQLYLVDGWLQIGSQTTDLFELTFNQAATCQIGAVTSDSVLVSALSSIPGRLSLAYGDFSLNFENASTLLVRDGGLMEVGLKMGQYTSGHVSNFNFTQQSVLDLENTGRLAIAQPNLSSAGSLASNFYFNNEDGTTAGSGFVLLYTEFSNQPFAEGQLHSQDLLDIEGGDALTLFKNLVRQTKLRADIVPNPNLLGLEQAADFYDSSGNYDLLTNQNALVILLPGDVLRREAPGGGAVFGTSAAGSNFVIQSNGSRSNI